MSDEASPSPAATPTATLTIHRTAPEDAKQRQIIMSLDGNEIATLLFGQRATRQIPAGRHFLTNSPRLRDTRIRPPENERQSPRR